MRRRWPADRDVHIGLRLDRDVELRERDGWGRRGHRDVIDDRGELHERDRRGGAGGAPSGTKLGAVSVFSGNSSATALHSYKAQAFFQAAADGAPGVFVASTVGPCEVLSFTTLPVPGTPVKHDAGAVVITGGKTPLTLTPDAMSVYADVKDSTHDLWNGGETITVTAAGAAVPAFTATAIAPAEVDVTLPVEPPNKGPLPVDRTQDLVFTWSNGGAGSVVAIFSDGATTKLTCTFPSSAGTGTVPKSALGALAASSLGFFVIEPASAQTLDVGGWTISVLLGSSLTWNGVPNPQTLSYQASN